MPPSGNLPSSKPRALLISPEAPYPMYGGGPLRTVSLIEYLRQRYIVDLIVFRNDYPAPIPPQTFGDVLQIRLPFHSRELSARIWRNTGRLLRQVPPLVDRFAGFESQIQEWLQGKYYDVARHQFDSMRTVLHFAESPALDQEVIDNDMFGSLAKKLRHFARRRRAESPRRCEFGSVVHRSFKLYQLENFRKSVHRGFSLRTLS